MCTCYIRIFNKVPLHWALNKKSLYPHAKKLLTKKLTKDNNYAVEMKKDDETMKVALKYGCSKEIIKLVAKRYPCLLFVICPYFFLQIAECIPHISVASITVLF